MLSQGRPKCAASRRTAGPLLATALLAGSVLASCGGLERGGQPVLTTPNAGVYAPSSQPYGKTYGEWSVAWWQWLFAIAVSENPIFDQTGDKAGVGQSGPVWFLVGTFGATAERTCTVPADKAVLFPIVNNIGVFNLPTDTEPAVRDYVTDSIDHVTELDASVDGVELGGLWNFRFEAPDIFLVTFHPMEPLADFDPVPPYPPGTFRAFADGYWVMLEPLSPGKHTITWRGKQVRQAVFPSVDVFEQTITYHLTIE